jgi:hypothetical protein
MVSSESESESTTLPPYVSEIESTELPVSGSGILQMLLLVCMITHGVFRQLQRWIVIVQLMYSFGTQW